MLPTAHIYEQPKYGPYIKCRQKLTRFGRLSTDECPACTGRRVAGRCRLSSTHEVWLHQGAQQDLGEPE